VGEIAEALKRQREEREATEAGAAPPTTEAASPAGVTPTAGALAAAAAEAAPPHSPVVPGPVTEVHALDDETLDSLGKVELHRHLALQVAAQLENRSARCLAVVSALRDEGKTTVAATLALALASLTSHRCVALLDLDMRNPSIAGRLGLRPAAGIEQFLLGRADIESIRVPLEAPQLDVYPSVEPQPSAHELMARPQLAALIELLEQRYQTVIIDTPPTLIVPDASMLLKRVGACVAVARMEVSRTRRIREMLDILPPEVIVGKVLNSAALPSRDRSYYEYGYGTEQDSQAEADSEPTPEEVERSDA